MGAARATRWIRLRARLIGVLLIFHLLREAELALGEGDEEAAAGSLEERRAARRRSSEPQWIGMLGSLLGDLRRAPPQLPEARRSRRRSTGSRSAPTT